MKKDWIECELGEVCEINMGQSPPSSTYNMSGNGMPFFQGKAEFTELYPIVKNGVLNLQELHMKTIFYCLFEHLLAQQILQIKNVQ